MLALRPKYTVELSDTTSLEFVGSFLWMDYADWGANGHQYIQGGSERHWDFKTIFRTTELDGHRLAGGFIYGEKKFRDAEFYFSANPVEGFESLNTKWNEYGVFAEDIIQVTDRWTVSLGIRYDKYDIGDFEGQWIPAGYKASPIKGHISPRVAMAYELDPKTVLKASYQHGFRMPDAAYYNWNLANNAAAASLGYATSPGLKPEEMDSYELNLVKEFNEDLTVNLNAFYNIFTDHLSWGPLTNHWTQAQVDAINNVTPAASWGWDGGMFQNIEGKFQTAGGEAAFDWNMTEQTKIITSYGYAKVINNKVEQRYPTHQIKLNLTQELIKQKLFVGFNYVFQSSYNTKMHPDLHPAYKDNRNVVDLFLVYDVNKNVRVKAVAKNVFANKTPPGGFLMDRPGWGNLGYDEPRLYLSTEIRF